MGNFVMTVNEWLNHQWSELKNQFRRKEKLRCKRCTGTNFYFESDGMCIDCAEFDAEIEYDRQRRIEDAAIMATNTPIIPPGLITSAASMHAQLNEEIKKIDEIMRENNNKRILEHYPELRGQSDSVMERVKQLVNEKKPELLQEVIEPIKPTKRRIKLE